jgi:hypothetical protein
MLLHGAVSGTGLSGSSSSEGGTFTVTSNATALNTASTIVARDGSGNFAAGTVTAALSGNSTTATALATGRTIGMTGDVVWTSASFDGSGNVTGTATIQANSVALGTDTTGNYVAAGAVSGTGLSGSSSSEGGTFTVTSNATNANTASAIVARDASGNFAAGTITAALTGNASTATTLQTARTIGGVSFNGAANINLPGVNTTGNQNTSGSSASCTGNAATATVLQTASTIGGVSFNGSANINLPGVNTGGNQDTSGTSAISTAATVTTSSAASAFKVPFANTTASTTGNYGLLQDSTATFTYNPSTNVVEAGTFNATSDISLKENICTFENAMDVVAGLRGVRFTWKKNGIKTVGLIAQEVEKVLPELIGTNADTGLKSVSYANMVAVLIEAVKELKAEIEELKKR